LPGKGRIHPFVPFDPARELAHRKGLDCPDGGPEKHSSLALVKDAIEHRGFIGVKVYNSLGYKPFNNAEVDEKRHNIRLHENKGYADALTGRDYDEVLSELYDYCVENEVPITAHCVMDGIESYPRASFDFCKATFWREVLDQDRYKDLRVNLAHFGWSPAYGYDGAGSWVQDICRMVTEYKHLYTDVSHHHVLTTRDRRRFKQDYAKMRADAGDRWPELKSKILFGIDWHVTKRVRNFERFQEAYATVLEEGASYTSEDMDQFLSGNAMRFLGLEQGGKNRQRLTEFYQVRGIDPPAWFQ
jgi:predicted TIM-barrel fold metal-dependent hydrolase